MSTEILKEIETALSIKGEWMGKLSLNLIKGVSPFNARKHRIEENIHQLEDSIGLTGEIREPLTLNQDFQIVKGQRRYIVAKRWKFKEVPVIIRMYKDRMVELADSHCENQLTYPLSTEDDEDVIYTLAKQWGQEKTAQHLGISTARVSNVVRFREAPEKFQEMFKDESIRVQRHGLAFFKEITKKEGVESAIKQTKLWKELPDLDRDQVIKDWRLGEPVDLSERLKRARTRYKNLPQYNLFTMRLDKSLSSKLTAVARKMNKDKLELISEILQEWVEKHKRLPEV